MRHRNFHKPVQVQIGRVDRDQVVTNTRHAALLLLKNWPNRDSPKRRSAMKACLQVIRGEKPPSVARRAFIAAARDVSVLLNA